MASGHVKPQTGRTHGCTDQQRDVKIFLANQGERTSVSTARAARAA